MILLEIILFLVESCQAFKMQHSELMREKVTPLVSQSKGNKHKGYRKLEDDIQRLRYENDWAELRNEWNADADPPDDGKYML